MELRYNSGNQPEFVEQDILVEKLLKEAGAK